MSNLKATVGIPNVTADGAGNLNVNVQAGGAGGGVVQIEDTNGDELLSNGSGALQVAVVSGGGSNPSVGTTGSTAPTSATEIGVIDGSGNLRGASASFPVRVDPTGTTPQPITVSGSLPVTEVPATSGGVSTNVQAALSDSAVAVKASAGQLYGYSFFNPNNATVYLFFYNTATPTVGSTTPIYVIGMPAGAAGHISFGIGIPFGTGIYVLASTAINSAGAPSTGIVVTSLYD